MKILLVDDDLHSRQSLAGFLTSLNHDVTECYDGKNALENLSKNRFNLVLSDICMPNMDGNELLKHIRKADKWRDLIVILITGYGDVKNAVEAMKMGAYDYMLKPINVEELAKVMDRISEILSLKEENKELKQHFEKRVNEATKDVKNELSELKKAFAREVGIGSLGIFSKTMIQVFETAEKLHNKKDIAVLIEGETGTGKEVIARYIHHGKEIDTSPFVGLNCAAISQNLFESELFGYESGAFTGGNPKGQIGKLELAKNGSIFLDEIAELATEYQAKLLRVIQEREYYRIGGLKKFDTNARFICATNRNIKDSLADGTFREDLYYRLNVGYVKIPPLRERKEEILPLANMFLSQLNKEKKTTFLKISSGAVKVLKSHVWPGNVRELKNAIERIALLWDEKEIKSHHLQFIFSEDLPVVLPKKEVEEEKEINIKDIPLPGNGIDLDKWTLDLVRRTLEKFNGNKTDAAKFLGISRNVLYTYLKKL